MQVDLFHNTIGLLPSEKAQREVKVSRQVDRVLDFFKEHPHSDFTPCEVYLKFGQQYPLTSIRRSISDLTKMGELVKTDRMRKGMFNEVNHTWRYGKA